MAIMKQGAMNAGYGLPTLVFLHYFGGAGASWNAVIEELGTGVHCIAPNLCGFGKSHYPDIPLNVDAQAEEMLGRIEFLGLKRYVLVGHSMGGKIAMAMAALRPAGLQSLVLLAPSPPTPEPMTEEARMGLLEMFGKADKIEAHLQKIVAYPLPAAVLAGEVSTQLLASHLAWRGWVEAGSREDISDRMHQIAVPVRVVGGAADKTFTPDFLIREVTQRLPDANLQTIVGAGHLLPLEKPAKVSEAILANLAASG